MTSKVNVETRYRARLFFVILTCAIVAQPYAMFWQAMDGNGGVRWVIDAIGLAWFMNLACIATALAIFGVGVGLWKFKVYLNDVELGE